ncbi:MAG: endonuclease MutS2 [Lachnospiraceae bacterium]|nr:endonuclease MutS2 [Lachnospiraceae bacterium]
MNDKVLNTLEYNKIINMLADKATSEPGKKKCLELKPSADLSEVTKLQQETFDAVGRLLRNGSVNFGNNKDIGASLLRLDKGSSVNAVELLNIAGLLENTARVKSYGRRAETKSEVPIEGDPEGIDSLTDMFTALEPYTQVSTEIRRCILSEDEIADDASGELRNIRRLKRVTGDKIHTRLNSMVNNTYKSYLQDSVVTMREGRYCIPVKAEYKGNVPGMIHDRSATSSTFFIEPTEIVNLNNELRELDIKEAKEIEVILATLSAQCGEHTEEIRLNQVLLTELDHIFARGQLALDMKATRPDFNREGIINLKKARHPLLDKKKCVPIDIRLGDNFDLLIITGPNTGGKTVALKTLGLLTLMGQSGLMIPANDHSRLSVFDEVFADIGDEQSIEQSLSTFSSHMKTIVDILDKADKHSLCLFDELGAGTDPVEGAALATAILERLHESGIRTAATTHYSELKVYALRKEGVCNASCEFNVETLSPTYRLLIGVPGKSNAFAIAGKLGLKDDIIESARDKIGEADESLEDVLAELEKARRMLEEEQLAIDELKKEADSLKSDYEAKKAKIDKQREKILEEARDEALEVLTKAKEDADEAIRNFQKHGTIQDMEKMRAGLRDSINKIRSEKGGGIGAASKEEKRTENKASDFKLGESVRIISMGLTGTVNSLPDSKGNLFVQCGIMRMQAHMNDIEFLESVDITGPGLNTGGKSKSRGAGGKSSGGSSGYGISTGLNKASSISMELNLIGCTTDEAIPKLEKYLDDAYLSHLESVRIVHGKGTGALRNAVWNQLKRIKYVKSYKLAEYGEGDAGVTIVVFK